MKYFISEYLHYLRGHSNYAKNINIFCDSFTVYNFELQRFNILISKRDCTPRYFNELTFDLTMNPLKSTHDAAPKHTCMTVAS